MTTGLDEASVNERRLLVLFSLLITLSTALSQDQATNCSINGRFALYQRKQDCINTSWEGFIGPDCCGEAFNEYLYALAQRSRSTSGQIFLDSQEQNKCLISMKTIDKDIFECGIQNLTSRGSGCSDFTVNDVQEKLGDGLDSLKEACQFPDQDCTACAMKWKEIGRSSPYGGNSSQAEADLSAWEIRISP